MTETIEFSFNVKSMLWCPKVAYYYDYILLWLNTVQYVYSAQSHVCIWICTWGEEFACPQEADGQSHDGGFIQVWADVVWKGKLVGNFVEHLRLLTAPAARRITRLLLTPIWAAPTIWNMKICDKNMFPFVIIEYWFLHWFFGLKIFFFPATLYSAICKYFNRFKIIEGQSQRKGNNFHSCVSPLKG